MGFYRSRNRKPRRMARPRTEPKPVIRGDETQEQITVADYLTLIGALFLHIPNEGQRSPVTAAVLKRMGLKKGAPDLIIFEPRGKYHGFAIEMKAAGGRLTPEQRMMLFELSKRQYATACCHGADEAIKLIRKYMAQPNTAKEENNDAKT